MHQGKNLLSSIETIQLFDAATIDSLDWPLTNDGAYAKKLLTPLIKNGIRSYIDNIDADILVLKIDQLVLPVIIAHENYANSYVCSPYSHYISFGQEFVGLIANRLIGNSVKSILGGIGHLCRRGHINSVVYVNNWLFSTDLYPAEISKEQIASIVILLKNRFPEHAIAMRSLNSVMNQSLQIALKDQGFDLIASRHVYITDATQKYIFETRILKSDLKLRRTSTYEFLDETKIGPQDCQHLLDLYHTLYITQHSKLQPQFTLRYIQLLLKEDLLKFKIIKKGSSIDGVAGYYERNGMMFCPFFGYDKRTPEHNIVYRLLNTELLMEAKKQKLIFHQSAGASMFKKIRRAEGCLESMAIYTKHLPLKQRLSWKILSGFINALGPRYMKNY